MSADAVPAANRNERIQGCVTVGAIHEPPVRFNHIGSGSMRSNCPRFMVPIGHVYSSGLSSNGKAVFAFMLPEALSPSVMAAERLPTHIRCLRRG